MANFRLDALDRKILGMIASDARIAFLEVARECGVSGAAIHQRVQKLTQMGVLKGSEFILNSDLIGYGTCAYVGLFLKDPMDSVRVINALLAIPEIVECHCTSGDYDLFIKLYARDNRHLLSIINDSIQPIGIQRSETIISFREAFKRQMPIPKS